MKKESSNYLSEEEARELQDNWVATRAVEIQKARGAEDSREFLFSVDELQEFLNYIKANTSSMTPGVRIYLAAYDEKPNDMATVFLSPTLDITKGSPNDYTLQSLNRAIMGWPPLNY